MMQTTRGATGKEGPVTGKRWLLVGLLASLAVIFAAGCGDDDDDDDDDDEAAEVGDDEEDDDGAADDDAATIDISGVEELEDGTLTALINVPYPPLEFLGEGGEDDFQGFSPDLMQAIGERLGVEIEFVSTGFEAILEELNAGDGDVVISSITFNPEEFPERAEAADFVLYLNVGTGIAVQAGNPEGVAEVEDLCGLAVSVQEGTIQEEQLRGANEDFCSDNQIELIVLADQGLVTQELAEGNVDAFMADLPVVLDAAAAFPEEIEATEYNEPPAPYGIAILNGSPIGDVLVEAINALIDDGTYAEILETWGLTEAAIEESTIGEE
jgi:polar amino acid transport system substrate-binding protein